MPNSKFNLKLAHVLLTVKSYLILMTEKDIETFLVWLSFMELQFHFQHYYYSTFCTHERINFATFLAYQEHSLQVLSKQLVISIHCKSNQIPWQSNGQ